MWAIFANKDPRRKTGGRSGHATQGSTVTTNWFTSISDDRFSSLCINMVVSNMAAPPSKAAEHRKVPKKLPFADEPSHAASVLFSAFDLHLQIEIELNGCSSSPCGGQGAYRHMSIGLSQCVSVLVCNKEFQCAKVCVSVVCGRSINCRH